MATMNQKNMAESISVRVPQISAPSSSSPTKSSPKVGFCNTADCCSDQLMVQNHGNFKLSAAPARLMFNQGGSWVNFQNEVLESMLPGFLEGKSILEAVIEGTKYAFDFMRMVQIDLGSGSQRSIAWIDEKGKPFFPKLFLDEDFIDVVAISGSPKMDIEIRVEGDAGKRKGENLDIDGKDVEVSSLMKSNKQDDEVNVSKRQRSASMDLEVKWPNVKLLNEKDKLYSIVSNAFLKGMTKTGRGATITAIHHVVLSGPLENARRQAFARQTEITKASRGVPNTVHAWYAASPEAVATILTHGFGVPGKVSEFPVYGVGVHLSPSGLPLLSDMLSEVDDNGEKHMILCRVILGNVERIEAFSQQSRPSSADFDTGADDPRNPKWYVVWNTSMNRHILPECVVSYKASTRMPLPVQPGASDYRKHSLSEFISIIKNHLPSSKLQEALTLYGTFKDGKLAKESFSNQLRAIVGDEVHKSVLQEIRSSG